MDKTINITGPVSVTLEPTEVLVIVTGLKKLPYEVSQPVIDHLFQACQPPPPVKKKR